MQILLVMSSSVFIPVSRPDSAMVHYEKTEYTIQSANSVDSTLKTEIHVSSESYEKVI